VLGTILALAPVFGSGPGAPRRGQPEKSLLLKWVSPPRSVRTTPLSAVGPCSLLQKASLVMTLYSTSKSTQPREEVSQCSLPRKALDATRAVPALHHGEQVGQLSMIVIATNQCIARIARAIPIPVAVTVWQWCD